MAPIAFILQIYFAMLLGISGLAKVDARQRFAKTLRQQKILPQWSIGLVSRVFPWSEVLLALALISGIAEQLTALLLLLLFTVFLAVKSFLFVTKSDADCGCTASAKPQPVDGTSIITALLFVVIASLHLGFLARLKSAVSWPWRIGATLLFVGFGCFLIGKIVITHRREAALPAAPPRNPNIGLPVGEAAPSFFALDQDGEKISFDDFQAQRRLVLFVSPGCSACPGALRALDEVLSHEQKLTGLVIVNSDYATSRLYAAEQRVKVPLLTPDRSVIVQQYQIQAFPFALVLDEMGVIRAKGIVNVAEQVQALLQTAYQAA